MKGKATSIDIAYRAGVSQATVSRALRGSALVSPETRSRVQQIAQELNYKVDKHASSLRRQHSATLALLLFEDPTSNDSLINPFFLSMLGHVTRACARQGYDLLVSFQQLSDDWHADYRDSHKADGIILLGYGDYRTARGKLERLVEQGTCFVRWGAVHEHQPGVSIGTDNVHGGELATAHLLALNRERIAFVGTATEACPEFLDRYMGYQKAHRDSGREPLPELYMPANDSVEHVGYLAAHELCARGVHFDALFAASDLLAVGAMRALEEHGLRVPVDVAVVGFDDVPMAAFANPPLTTVLQDTRAAGELLVENLVRQVRGEHVKSTLIPAQLVVRRSCGSSG